MNLRKTVGNFRGCRPGVRLLFLAAWACPGIAIATPSLRLHVDSGSSARKDCPVQVTLPEDLAGGAEPWQLVELREREVVPTPHEVLGESPRTLAWILAGETPALTRRTFELRPAEATDAKRRFDPDECVRTVADPQNVQIRHRGRPLLTYRWARRDPPPGADPKYGRSGHIHPVQTPSGTIVSDEFPPDHLHQSGVFLAYTKTRFRGRPVNFWELLGGTGLVRSGELLEQYEGPVCGGFRVQLEHVALGEAASPEVALIEEWEVRAWNSELPQGWRFDITSSIRCASNEPLQMQQYHYGGMAYRGARGWTPENCRFTNPPGQSRETGNHSRVPWVDLSGKSATEWAGMTVFSDPANFRFPEPVRLHPTMPYFVFTPAVLGDWSIEPGKTHVSRYHYWVHDGEFERADADRVWAEISDPPRVELEVVGS